MEGSVEEEYAVGEGEEQEEEEEVEEEEEEELDDEQDADGERMEKLEEEELERMDSEVVQGACSWGSRGLRRRANELRALMPSTSAVAGS